MTGLFDSHRATLDAALTAAATRGYWSAYPEAPGDARYGAGARTDGAAAFEALLGRPFELPGHPEEARGGAETSPYGRTLGIGYPTAGVAALIAAAQAAAPAWAAAGIDTRTGLCLEILARLNRASFVLANAVMHTTGQAFAMAFQAGGPHAQDRGLEAVAYAWAEMTRTPAAAVWSKPQGRGAPIVLEKRWRAVPRGIALVIACQTFPTWNSYPGLFASLATGNPVVVKPHPGAILPLALTVRIARETLVEQGFDPNTVLLAADVAGEELTRDLVHHPAAAIIDYTGSTGFGTWVRSNGRHARIYAEEGAVNCVVVAGTDDFDGMCANLAFSLALYSGQMCTAPQAILVPRGGIATDRGHKSFDAVASGIAAAVDRLLEDPGRAVAVCGAIASAATLERIGEARAFGTVVRDSAPIPGQGNARTATPLILRVDAVESEAWAEERFGPIAFVVGVGDAAEGIARAAGIARERGAITAALYARDEATVARAADAFAAAGVNLSVNLTGGVYVNQSAAFSDYHVTGANPAGNASLTDAAFVVERFRVVMLRRPMPAATQA